MPLINCELNFISNWSVNCFILAATVANQLPTFAINNTKLYVLVVTLSIQDNAKLLQQFKSSFKRTINWNKYQSKVTTRVPKQYLDYLIDRRFQRVNRLFISSYENINHRASYFFQLSK